MQLAACAIERRWVECPTFGARGGFATEADMITAGGSRCGGQLFGLGEPHSLQHLFVRYVDQVELD